MDLDIARWILEFLLRQPINDGLVNRALSTLPLSNSDLHLKKTILLRTIESKISKGSVSEKILELLEIIAEMDKREGIVVSESMKAAYCAVAVNCTVRFLEENCNEQGEYFNTVKRIWRGRIGTMKKLEEAVLISDELLTWRDDLEAAIWDSNVYQNVSKRDTRNEALKAVRVYVDGAWKAIGPTFLELAAQTMGKSVEKGQRMGKDPVSDQVGNMVACGDLGVSNRCPEREKDHRAACSNNISCELAVGNSNTMRDKDQIGEQAITSGQDFDVGVRSPGRDKEQVEEGAGTLSEVAVSDGNQDKEQVEEGAETLPEIALSGGSQDKEQVEEGAATLPEVPLSDGNQDKEQVEEGAATLPEVPLSDGNQDKEQVEEGAATLPEVALNGGSQDREQVEEGSATLPEVALSDGKQDKEQVEEGLETLPEVASSDGSQHIEQVEEGAATLPEVALSDRNKDKEQVEEGVETLPEVASTDVSRYKEHVKEVAETLPNVATSAENQVEERQRISPNAGHDSCLTDNSARRYTDKLRKRATTLHNTSQSLHVGNRNTMREKDRIGQRVKTPHPDLDVGVGCPARNEEQVEEGAAILPRIAVTEMKQVEERERTAPDAVQGLGITDKGTMGNKDYLKERTRKRKSSLQNTSQEMGVGNKKTTRGKVRIGERVETSRESLDVGVGSPSRDKEQVEEEATTLPNVAVSDRNQVEERGPDFPDAVQDVGGIDKPAMRDQDHVRKRGPDFPDGVQDVGVIDKPAMRDQDQVRKREANLHNISQELGVGSRNTMRDKDRIGQEVITSHRELNIEVGSSIRDKEQVGQGVATLPNVVAGDRNRVEERGPTSLDAGLDLGVIDKSAMRDKDHVGKRTANLHNNSQELGVGNRNTVRGKDGIGQQVGTSGQGLDVDVGHPTRDKEQVEEGADTLPNLSLGGRNQVEERGPTLSDVGEDLRATDKPAMRDKNQAGERLDSSPRVSAVRDKDVHKGNVLPEPKHVGGRGRRRGVKIVDTEELGMETSSNTYDCIPTPEVDKVCETLKTSCMDLQAVVKDPLPDALLMAETVRSDLARKNMFHESSVENRNEVNEDAADHLSDKSVESAQLNNVDVHEGNVLPEPKHVGGRGRRRGVKIVDTEELGMETSSNTYDCIPTPEVDKVCKTLKTSCMDLQAVVKDPLRDALLMAETVRSDLARKNMIHESSVENRNEVNEDHLSDKSVEPAQLNNSKHGNHCSRRGPSLMERNSTARTYEWDDSIDNLPDEGTSRFHLPSPKRKAVSPLKKYESRKNIRRRKIKKWSVLEEDTLRTGVSKFGRGNWKLILNAYRDIFEERTEVDLKDKWRNLTR